MFAKLKAAVGVALMLFGSAAANAARPVDVDKAFASQAAQGHEFEIAAGKLAATRGLAPALKQFAQQMVDDHLAAAAQLKSLADAKQWLLDKSLSAEQQTALGKLETLTGSEFDKTYAQLMVKDHVEDVGKFEQEAQKGKDADVKAYADGLLPTLRHHLAMANRIDAQAKKAS